MRSDPNRTEMIVKSRSNRQYEVILAFNPGKTFGMCLGVSNPSGKVQLAKAALPWEAIVPFFDRIDMVIGVYRGHKEYAQVLEYLTKAADAGCEVDYLQPHFPLMLEFPTRPVVAQRGLEFFLGVHGKRPEKYVHKLTAKAFTLMLPRRGEKL